MSGKLIIISGYSGSGKSTLIGGAIKQLDGVEYLHTVTTRPQRSGEVDSIEYDFLSDNEYNSRRDSAVMWDHVEHQGFKYGVDIDWVYGKLKSGTHLICAIAPEPNIYMKLKKLYGGEPISIWIDIPKSISNERIQSDKIRSARSESDELRSIFTQKFSPSGEVKEDIGNFTEQLSNLVND